MELRNPTAEQIKNVQVIFGRTLARVRWASEGLYEQIVSAHPEAYQQMVARLTAQGLLDNGNNTNKGSTFDSSLSVLAVDPDDNADKKLWWKTEKGRQENMAAIQRLNEINRINQDIMMQQHLQMAEPYLPPMPGVQPYRPPTYGPQAPAPRVPQPGVPQPHQHQPPRPGQPVRR